MLSKLFDFANKNEGVIALSFTFLCTIGWCIYKLWRLYLSKFPFIIKETYENYDYYKSGKNRPKSPFFEPIRISCTNGEWHKDRINLHITLRREINLKYINFRFVDKKLFRNPNNIPSDMLSIENIIHPQDQYRSKLTCNDDKAGGLDCYFDPPIELLKNKILFFEIYPIINIPRNISQKIKCSISLEPSNEEKRVFPRKKVIIANEIIK